MHASSRRLSSRVVAITGASSGIGLATAEACARAGGAVVLFARRTDRLDDLVRSIAAAGGRAHAITGDVTNPSDLARLVDDAVTTFGGLDVMVCNAGIGFNGTLDDTPPDVMRRLVDVNLMGTFYAAQAALPVFRRQGRGHLIVMSSIVGRRGVGGSSVYSATKAAQIAFVEALRAEFVGTGLRASVVLPVGTATEFREAIQRDFGYVTTGIGPRQSADVVARRVVQCIVSPRAEIYPHRASRLLSVLNVVAPATTDRLMRRFGRRRKPIPTGSHEPSDT